jgi:tripartite ATP-independent transporter DctM subunit
MTVAPMFILMGLIANHSGIGMSLFKMANKFVGHLRGGLAIATQVACAAFGAVCGSMPATVATIGSVAYPEMKKYNYANPLATACITAGASLASLIPPSMHFIIYGVATETSIGKLFVAGILPGIVHMFLYIITVVIVTKIKPSWAPVGERASWAERINALRNLDVIIVAAVFMLCMGGLFAGWFTPTEAGSIGAFSLIVFTFIGRKMNLKKLSSSLLETTKLAATIMFLLASATFFGKFFALTRIPFELGAWIEGLNMPNVLVILLIMMVYLVLGCFIDALPLVLLTIPVFFPLVTTTLGYDAIWFGVITLVVVSMGSQTPPVGINIYILKTVYPGR